MKTSRLLIILLNAVLLVVLVYAGTALYFGDFLEEHTLSDYVFTPAPVPKPVGPGIADYQESIRQLAVKRDPPPPPPPPPTRTPLVQTGGIVYDRYNPASSGAHVIARGVPRYLAVGDNLPDTREKRYRLMGIREDNPDFEYTLVFADEKGQVREAKYRRK